MEGFGFGMYPDRVSGIRFQSIGELVGSCLALPHKSGIGRLHEANRR